MVNSGSALIVLARNGRGGYAHGPWPRRRQATTAKARPVASVMWLALGSPRKIGLFGFALMTRGRVDLTRMATTQPVYPHFCLKWGNPVNPARKASSAPQRGLAHKMEGGEMGPSYSVEPLHPAHYPTPCPLSGLGVYPSHLPGRSAEEIFGGMRQKVGGRAQPEREAAWVIFRALIP